jgi:bla regulator protein blaR1
MMLTNFSPLENHLWQSTLCVAVAWLLSLALKKNRAAVRYWLWFAASLKFLLPFSLLVEIGSRFGWRTSEFAAEPTGSLQWSTMITDVGRPFVASSPVARAATATAPHSVLSIATVLVAVWIGGFVVTVSFLARNWMRARAIERRGTRLNLALPIPAVSASTLIEPGVFGIFRPVLLLPEGISSRLSPAQFSAILTHEMCHVQRRDNLLAAIHMAVEAIFWFYPPVWWIGARMVEERERACDEEVLLSGSEPELYAQGIVNVCKFYTESPLACASGISGSDLKDRVVRIMTHSVADRLSVGRKFLLGSAAVIALAGPLIAGAVNAPHRAQSQSADGASGTTLPSFEVASIKPNRSGAPNRFFRFADPSRMTITNIPAKDLIGFAYHVQPFQISGGPGWINSQGYDIQAKVDDSVVARLQKLPPEERMDQFRLMLRALLVDRFKLKLDYQTKQLPIYALVVAKGGPKLTPTTLPPAAPTADAKVQSQPRGPMMMMSPGRLTARDVPISSFAEVLGRQPELGGRLVVDQTGLKGKYDFTLQFAPETGMLIPGTNDRPPMPANAPPPPDANAPSIFTAIQEQLGLKLEPAKGPVQTLVIESIEVPSEN